MSKQRLPKVKLTVTIRMKYKYINIDLYIKKYVLTIKYYTNLMKAVKWLNQNKKEKKEMRRK